MRYWVHVEKWLRATVVIDAPDVATALTRLPADPPEFDDSELWTPVAVVDENGAGVPLPDEKK